MRRGAKRRHRSQHSKGNGGRVGRPEEGAGCGEEHGPQGGTVAVPFQPGVSLLHPTVLPPPPTDSGLPYRLQHQLELLQLPRTRLRRFQPLRLLPGAGLHPRRQRRGPDHVQR